MLDFGTRKKNGEATKSGRSEKSLQCVTSECTVPDKRRVQYTIANKAIWCSIFFKLQFVSCSRCVYKTCYNTRRRKRNSILSRSPAVTPYKNSFVYFYGETFFFLVRVHNARWQVNNKYFIIRRARKSSLPLCLSLFRWNHSIVLHSHCSRFQLSPSILIGICQNNW